MRIKERTQRSLELDKCTQSVGEQGARAALNGGQEARAALGVGKERAYLSEESKEMAK